jgi:hypothetical protein
VTKLENGQLEVAPVEGAAPARKPAPAATKAAPARSAPAASAPPEEREGRARRGRRGRGRDRARDDKPAAAAAAPPSPAPAGAAPPAASESIGTSGVRLTRDEAFDVVRRAVGELANGDAPVPAASVRRRAFALLGRDSESLSDRNFSRILRDAHDAAIVDVRKRGDSFEVAPAASAPPVTEQLAKAEVAHAAGSAAAAGPKPRSITGRRPGRGKVAPPPADLLSVGVVDFGDDAPVAKPTKPAAKSAAKKATRKRAPRKKAAKSAES